MDKTGDCPLPAFVGQFDQTRCLELHHGGICAAENKLAHQSTQKWQMSHDDDRLIEFSHIISELWHVMIRTNAFAASGTVCWLKLSGENFCCLRNP